MVTSRTCEIPCELSQVSVEVIELDLCSQEDVRRFRKGEYTRLCAGALVGYRPNTTTQNITVKPGTETVKPGTDLV